MENQGLDHIDLEKKNKLVSQKSLFFGAILGSVEMFLGGALHFGKVPFAGHLLSLNQIFFLNLLQVVPGEQGEGQIIWTRRGAQEALVTSGQTLLWKGLSPMGKRLTPMVAIGMQGLIFSIPVMLLPSWPMALLGSWLSALWPFFQPVVLVLWLAKMTNINILSALTDFGIKVSEALHLTHPVGQNIFWWLVGGAVFLKLILVTFLCFAAWGKWPSLKRRYFNKLEQMILKFSGAEKSIDGDKIQSTQLNRNAKWWLPLIKSSIKDLIRPFSLLSMAIVLGTAFFAGEGGEQILWTWLMLRLFMVGFLTFFLVRIILFWWLSRQEDKVAYKGQLLQLALEGIQYLNGRLK